MAKYLATKRLLMRNATEADALMLSRWKSQFNLREMSVGLSTKITEFNQKSDIKTSISMGDLYIIIEIKESHTPIGYIRLGWLDARHERCWLSYGLANNYRQGYCYEALNRLLTALYRYDMVNIIDAEVFEFNIPSKNLLEKLGFLYDGRRKDDYYYKGRNWDIYKYVMNRERMRQISEEQISQRQY